MHSLTNGFVSEYFNVMREIRDDTDTFGILNLETHMMKNSEWAAVAYLSQSKYGKYGNKDYTDEQKEIYLNSSYVNTGQSSGAVPGEKTNTLYTYDGYMLNNSKKTETRDIKKGTGASTTGNIYGIYDMSGGNFEYVMGAFGLENSPIIADSKFKPSDVFTSGKIMPLYYDVYIYNKYDPELDLTKVCSYGNCLGHALLETEGWYNDFSKNKTTTDPWFLRGGANASGKSAGIFNYALEDGYADYSASARLSGFILRSN